MQKEDVQMLGFEIVAYAGEARSKFLEALQAAKGGDIAGAESLIEEGNQVITKAHNAQTELLANEAQGNDIPYSVTMMHGQDHLMTTLAIRDLKTHIIELYQRER